MKPSMIRLAASPKSTPRSHLEIGSQIFHNGAPVQLLYRVAHDRNRETWHVRPLFVEAPIATRNSIPPIASHTCTRSGRVQRKLRRSRGDLDADSSANAMPQYELWRPCIAGTTAGRTIPN